LDVKTVGVIGAGTIGRGVAQSFAQHGFRVVLVDLTTERLDDALAEIRTSLRVRSLFRQAPPIDAAEVLGRIEATTALKSVADAEFVVENVTEDWEVKKEVYLGLDEICPPGTTFAVNTSAIPITRVGSVTGRAAEVIGMHFMNPVPLVDMVEVVRGHFTSDATVAGALELLGRIGKEGVVVDDAPGFVTNRVLMPTINEAIFCVQDRVASAEEVDRIFRGCFGHKMGPLETADLIGLDTILNSITVLYESFRDDKYRPAPLLRRMVDAGLLGRKTGRGFHDYGN
jgi:3-hydroxybutyryl-CoA dehydrogenase